MADTPANETTKDLQLQFQLTEAEVADFTQIESEAAALSACTEKARLWMDAPLEVFDGKTPLELIKQGNAESILRYLNSLSVGFSG